MSTDGPQSSEGTSPQPPGGGGYDSVRPGYSSDRSPVPEDAGVWSSEAVEPRKAPLTESESRELGNTLKTSQNQGRLAMGILLLAALVLVGFGVLLAFDALTADEVKELLPLASGPIFTLLGTAAAFYFQGSK